MEIGSWPGWAMFTSFGFLLPRRRGGSGIAGALRPPFFCSQARLFCRFRPPRRGGTYGNTQRWDGGQIRTNERESHGVRFTITFSHNALSDTIHIV